MLPIATRYARAGIRICYDPTVRYAHTKCDKRGVLTTTFGQAYLDGGAELRSLIAEHEIAHVARGDFTRKNVHMDAWNIASDVVINESLAGLYDLPPDMVTYDKLAEELPDIRTCGYNNAMPIYTMLLHYSMQTIGCGSLLNDAELDDTQQAGLERARAIAASDAGYDLPRTTAYRIPPRTYSESSTERIIRRLSRVLYTLRGGVYSRHRSWGRPGRIPQLPGVRHTPGPRIGVAVDVSGSMEHVHLVTDYLANVPVDVRYYVWASRAARATVETIHSIDVGSGTVITPLVNLVDSDHCDAVIIISDAMIADSSPPPRTRAYWVLPKPHTIPWGHAWV